MPRTKAELRLARVEAVARYLCEEIVGPWEEQEADAQDAWRWRAARALDHAADAGGRGISRKK